MSHFPVLLGRATSFVINIDFPFLALATESHERLLPPLGLVWCLKYKATRDTKGGAAAPGPLVRSSGVSPVVLAGVRSCAARLRHRSAADWRAPAAAPQAPLHTAKLKLN